MLLVDKIIAIFSPQMRATLELARLNKLWERFNNGENVRQEVLEQRWKYHQDKVNLLLDFLKLTHPLENTKR